MMHRHRLWQCMFFSLQKYRLFLKQQNFSAEKKASPLPGNVN